MNSTPAIPHYILVDGSSYLYRAFHAMPPLTSSSGQPTGAVRGVINMLRKLCEEYSDSHVVVVFDAKGKTFRHDMFPDYKANRPSMPDELREQIEPIHKIVKAMGLPLIIVDGVEADDVIGTYAKQASDNQQHVLISTGDKDMAQLVNPYVRLMNTMSNEYLDEAGVLDKFGVPADRIIDYLALMGDKVDNIPGVNKCGPKTAVKWLTAYDSMTGVIEHADEVKGKVGEYLREATAWLPQSYDLATIRCELELDEPIETIQQAEPDNDELLALFTEYEFKSWIKELSDGGSNGAGASSAAVPTLPVETSYITMLDAAEFEAYVKTLEQHELIAFDTETTSLEVLDAELVGVSFSTKAGEGVYIPVAHDYLGAPPQIDRDVLVAVLKPLLENPDIKKVGQNLKYDRNVLLKYDIELQGIAFDTMVESYVLNATATRHDMNSLATHYLNHTCISFEDIAGKGKKQLTFNQIDLEVAGPYAAEDADICWRLHEHLWPQIEALQLESLFHDIEMPLVTVLADIEYGGVHIDGDLLLGQSAELKTTLSEIESKAYELAGEQFNLASPKQLADILFSEEKLQLPIVKKTKGGAPSTSEEVLQELALDYPLPKLLLNYRSLSKLKTTYTDKLPKMIHPTTQRVHTSYHQTVVATGRLSSTAPNLQNIPIKTDEGRRVRQAFVAQKGHKIVAADYSQIELRIMADLSKDEGLLEAFNNGEDIHKATAAEIFGVALGDVTTDMRRSAKAINFGLIYGMSAFGLAKQLGVGRHDAQEFMNVYFERYPGVKTYMNNVRAQAREDGFVETLFGRRLYLPDVMSSNNMRQQAALRAAINAPMQGTAADIIKRAMIQMHASLEQWNADHAEPTRMLMQVHDELVFDVPTTHLDEMSSMINEIMSSAADLSVPLVVDVGVGDNWDEAH
ncbi:MAG: DNA polymerase I [Pseudomonadota bacterium]